MDKLLTSRQFVALHLYYVEGLSTTRIGTLFGSSRQNAHEIVSTARAKVMTYCIDGDLDKTLLVEGLFKPSPLASVTRNVGIAALRQERLLDALDRRMAELAQNEADAEECMAGNHPLPTHVKRNHWDQWEMRYLSEKPGRHGIPTTAYRADRAARYCSSDWATCGLECVGCDRTTRRGDTTTR